MTQMQTRPVVAWTIGEPFEAYIFNAKGEHVSLTVDELVELRQWIETHVSRDAAPLRGCT
jgi:hypothetical protein